MLIRNGLLLAETMLPAQSLRGSTRLKFARLDSAQVCAARLGSTWLGSARLGSTRLDSTRLGSARLDSTRLDPARLDSTRPGSTHPSAASVGKPSGQLVLTWQLAAALNFAKVSVCDRDVRGRAVRPLKSLTGCTTVAARGPARPGATGSGRAPRYARQAADRTVVGPASG